MKKIFTICLSVMSLLSIATGALALSYTGFLESDLTFYATGGWATGTTTPSNAKLSWIVDDTSNVGFWTYEYTFTVARKGISHVIIEVSGPKDDPNAFSVNNIKAGTTSPYSLDTYNSSFPGNSNPGLPGNLYGIKWNTDDVLGQGDWLNFTWTLVTDRTPMWGDFYAKDGTDNQGQIDVYAYNVKFGQSTDASIGDGNAGGWALLPDTTVIPEPATMLLFGSGLIGLAGFVRRKFKK